MQILVNSSLGVALTDATNFKSFDLRVESGVDRSHLAKTLHGVAELDGDEHAWIDESWLLEQLARTGPPADWRASFDGMTDYARKKGWVRDNPTAIRAHIVD